MALAPDKIPDFNKDIAAWAQKTRGALLLKLASLDLESTADLLQRARARDGGRKPLSKSIKSASKKEFGQVELVRFSFSAHGWYFDRGVGKGTPIEAAGTGKRKPKPWIDVVLEDEVDKLADLVAEKYGDNIIDELKIRK